MLAGAFVDVGDWVLVRCAFGDPWVLLSAVGGWVLVGMCGCLLVCAVLRGSRVLLVGIWGCFWSDCAATCCDLGAT